MKNKINLIMLIATTLLFTILLNTDISNSLYNILKIKTFTDLGTYRFFVCLIMFISVAVGISYAILSNQKMGIKNVIAWQYGAIMLSVSLTIAYAIQSIISGEYRYFHLVPDLIIFLIVLFIACLSMTVFYWLTVIIKKIVKK